MVKHIILWQLRDDIADKAAVAARMKSELEGLQGQIPGLLAVRVHITPLNGSNADVMLDTSFTDEQALEGYRVHPAHVAAADTYVRPFTKTRLCMDFAE